MASKRLYIVQDLLRRLGFIQVDKGYSSDAGLHIFAGELPKLGADDPVAALAVLLGPDEPLEGGRFTAGASVRSRIPILIHATAQVPRDATALLIYEGLIEDIKRAVEIESTDAATGAPDPTRNAARDRYLGEIPGTPVRPASLPTSLERGATQWHFREGGSEIVGVTVNYSVGVEEGWGQP